MKSIPTLVLAFLTVCVFSHCQKSDLVNMPPSVDAGNAQTVILPVSTASLAGAGTDADGEVVSYFWIQLSGPNNAVIASQNSGSASVGGLAEGTYIFQLLVIDNLGASAKDTVGIKVEPPEVVSLSLTVDQNYEINFAGNPNDDYSDENTPELDAGAWTRFGLLDLFHGAFKFDLAQIPANSTIISAKLTLFSNPTPLNGNQIDANLGSNNSMLIQRITAMWDLSSTWQNQPSTTTSNQVSIPHTNLSRLDLVDVDVTKLVKEMHATQNHGFMIRLRKEEVYNLRNFCSSRHVDETKHPKLVISYGRN